jgi:hypothetical protein
MAFVGESAAGACLDSDARTAHAGARGVSTSIDGNGGVMVSGTRKLRLGRSRT